MISVKVPATSANMGSGFDSIGVALALYNYVQAELSDKIDITSNSTVIPLFKNNLIFKTARHIFHLCGKKLDGLRIIQQNNVPMTRGLGSSSNCVVAGAFIANEMLGNPFSQDEIINICAKIEGHPDNVAPTILGGLTVSVYDGKRVHYVRHELSDKLRFVALIPNFELKTKLAREALPDRIHLHDAVFNLSRSALLTASLIKNDFANLRVAVDDRIHQPSRLGLIKNADDIFTIAYNFDAYGVYISGAGSTIIAIIDSSNRSFCDNMKKQLDFISPDTWEIHNLSVDNSGIEFC